MATSAIPSTATSSLPDGISKPYAAITDDDTSGLIAILTAFALGLVLISVAVRIYARHTLSRYRADDYTFFLAALLAIVEAAVVFFGLTKGLGRGLGTSNHSRTTVQKVRYAGDLLYLFTIFLSKISTGFLFLNLTPIKGHHKVTWTVIGASVVWIVSAAFVEGIRCNAHHPWTDSTTSCENSFARWLYISILDSLIEVGLFSLSIFLIWGIQMPWKSKAIVVGAFSFHLLNIVTSLLRLYYQHMSLSYDNVHFWATRVVSTTQFAIGYSITASVVPYLKPFMMAYEQPDSRRSLQHDHSGSNDSYKLFALSSTGSNSEDGPLRRPMHVSEGEVNERPKLERRLPKRILRAGFEKLRPDQSTYEVKAVGVIDRMTLKRGDDHGSTSDDSRRTIIRKGVDYSVHYDDESRRMSLAPSKATSSRSLETMIL